MKVIICGVMPDETEVQIEDWSEDYSFHAYADKLAAYPKSKTSMPGLYAPKQKEIFRADFNFKSHGEAQQAFDALVSGKALLSDYRSAMWDRVRYEDCI